MLTTPPFPTGADLTTALTRNWTVGTVEMIPGSSATSRTWVHVPTCAWMASTVPTAPDPSHALTSTVVSGYTLFLLYDVTVTPGTVAWSWGDGSTTMAPRSGRARPSKPSGIRPVDAALDRSLRGEPRLRGGVGGRDDHGDRDVHGDDHRQLERRCRNAHASRWHAMPTAGGACRLTIGPGDGWQSGPHPVDQIEPVPYQPASPTP